MMKKYISCFNKKNLSKKKTHPVDKQVCSICLSNSKNLVNYPCDTCTTDAWLICKKCLAECKKRDNRCPVCRTKVIEIVIHSEPDPVEVYIPKTKKGCKCFPIIIYDKDNDCDHKVSCCQMFHFTFTCVSYILGCILIGMIVPTTICYNNCGKQNTICTISGLTCGIIFCLMIGIFFRPKNEVNEGVRCIVSLIGSLMFVFTISITGDVNINTQSFLWLVLVLPACCCLGQRSIE